MDVLPGSTRSWTRTGRGGVQEHMSIFHVSSLMCTCTSLFLRMATDSCKPFQKHAKVRFSCRSSPETSSTSTQRDESAKPTECCRLTVCLAEDFQVWLSLDLRSQSCSGSDDWFLDHVCRLLSHQLFLLMFDHCALLTHLRFQLLQLLRKVVHQILVGDMVFVMGEVHNEDSK